MSGLSINLPLTSWASESFVKKITTVSYLFVFLVLISQLVGLIRAEAAKAGLDQVSQEQREVEGRLPLQVPGIEAVEDREVSQESDGGRTDHLGGNRRRRFRNGDDLGGRDVGHDFLVLGLRFGIGLGDLRRIRQSEVVLPLLAHPVRVGRSVVPLDPDPTVLTELSDDTAFRWRWTILDK